MKKILPLLVLSISAFPVFSYTSTDVSNASFLATEGIIVQQSSTAGYRLDATITRAEVMGIALKMKGIVLPNYQCKGYYTDVRSNGWICRAVELAADAGIITRSNTKARPQDSITRAEALAMVMKAGGLSTNIIPSSENENIRRTMLDTTHEWQSGLLLAALEAGIIDKNTLKYTKIFNSEFGDYIEYLFYPNRPATRAEVFAFAKPINESSNLNTSIEESKFHLSLPVDWTAKHSAALWADANEKFYYEDANGNYFQVNIDPAGSDFATDSVWRYKKVSQDSISIKEESPLCKPEDGFCSAGDNKLTIYVLSDNVGEVKLGGHDYYFLLGNSQKETGVNLQIFRDILNSFKVKTNI